MSIENFLENFDKQSQDEQKNLERIKTEKEQKRKELDEFLEAFQKYVTSDVLPELKAIEKKLFSKFLWEQSAKLLSPHNITFAIKIILVPKFEKSEKTISISIQADSENKMISFFGRFENPTSTGPGSQSMLNHFNKSFAEFKKVSLEAEIETTLNKAFLKK